MPRCGPYSPRSCGVAVPAPRPATLPSCVRRRNAIACAPSFIQARANRRDWQLGKRSGSLVEVAVEESERKCSQTLKRARRRTFACQHAGTPSFLTARAGCVDRGGRERVSLKYRASRVTATPTGRGRGLLMVTAENASSVYPPTIRRSDPRPITSQFRLGRGDGPFATR